MCSLKIQNCKTIKYILNWIKLSSVSLFFVLDQILWKSSKFQIEFRSSTKWDWGPNTWCFLHVSIANIKSCVIHLSYVRSNRRACVCVGVTCLCVHRCMCDCVYLRLWQLKRVFFCVTFVVIFHCERWCGFTNFIISSHNFGFLMILSLQIRQTWFFFGVCVYVCVSAPLFGTNWLEAKKETIIITNKG